MGTWGTGPFDNDAAGDLLDELAECAPDERVPPLRQLFAAVLRDPDADSYEVAFPSGSVDGLTADEVVAGAALVALALPGGGQRLDALVAGSPPDGGIREFMTSAAVPAPSHDLVALAAEALRVVTAPTRSWHRAWLDDADRTAAVDSVMATLRVLDDAVS